MPLHVVLLRPFQNGGTGEFCSVVTDNALWLSIEAHQRIQFLGHALPRQAGIGNKIAGPALRNDTPRRAVDNAALSQVHQQGDADTGPTRPVPHDNAPALRIGRPG
jgi:hypothetical protein